MAFLSSIGDRPHLLIGERRNNPSLRGIKGRGRLLPELILGMDKRHVRQANEPEDVPQIPRAVMTMTSFASRSPRGPLGP
jgi:hypothetical protein